MLNRLALLLNSAYNNYPGRGSLEEQDLGSSMPPYSGGPGQQQEYIGAGGAGRLGTGYGPGRGERGFTGAPDVYGMNWGLRGPDGTGVAGMTGVAPKTGQHMAEYYPLGMIPTGSNMEHVSQFAKRYRYSDTPDMGKMIRAPWRPETWDPEYDMLPEGGRRPGFRHTGGSRRRRR